MPREKKKVGENAVATTAAPAAKAKRFKLHNLSNITPLTERQKRFFKAFESGKDILALGDAGTGKSFIAIYMALKEILDSSKPQDKLRIVRSVVPTRNTGFQPGNEDEKGSHYEGPYYDILASLLEDYDAYESMKRTGQLEFCTTSFLRGSTWHEEVIFIDEIQNLNWHEIHSTVTRRGHNSRLIICGDSDQCDFDQRKEKSGLPTLEQVAYLMGDFEIIHFTEEDCVRSDFVRRWHKACKEVFRNMKKEKGA